MRKAVIFVNSFNIFLQLIRFIVIMLAIGGVIQSEELIREYGVFLDDNASEAVKYATATTVFLFSIVFYLCGLMGAYLFSKCLVLIAFLWYSFEIIMVFASWGVAGHVMTLSIPHLVWLILFLYPHFFLAMEINSGVMTPKTYPAEERGCCC